MHGPRNVKQYSISAKIKTSNDVCLNYWLTPQKYSLAWDTDSSLDS
jgi:hypothetical protein